MSLNRDCTFGSGKGQSWVETVLQNMLGSNFNSGSSWDTELSFLMLTWGLCGYVGLCELHILILLAQEEACTKPSRSDRILGKLDFLRPLYAKVHFTSFPLIAYILIQSGLDNP